MKFPYILPNTSLRRARPFDTLYLIFVKQEVRGKFGIKIAKCGWRYRWKTLVHSLDDWGKIFTYGKSKRNLPVV